MILNFFLHVNVNELNYSERKCVQGIKCVNSLDMSPWSPPPASRKLRGDLLYVRVVTLENVTLHLTACSRGFYVNMFDSTHYLAHHYTRNNINILTTNK